MILSNKRIAKALSRLRVLLFVNIEDRFSHVEAQLLYCGCSCSVSFSCGDVQVGLQSVIVTFPGHILTYFFWTNKNLLRSTVDLEKVQ